MYRFIITGKNGDWGVTFVAIGAIIGMISSILVFKYLRKFICHKLGIKTGFEVLNSYELVQELRDNGWNYTGGGPYIWE